MIKIENVEVMGWEHAIRGMRNPMNSWDKCDSDHGCRGTIGLGCHEDALLCKTCGFNPNWCGNTEQYVIGPNDHTLMMNLAHGGPVHAKYRRMITVYLDITAPLYWWKEFDTYKVGTVANSCSTMHKIHAKEFTLDDFSLEHVFPEVQVAFEISVLSALNVARNLYLDTKDKAYWWHMIQLLPTSYNQKRTVMLNYEVLVNMYDSRKHHKLDEWREFCKWVESLPYAELIVGEKEEE